MAYCTQADVEKVETAAQVIQLTDDANSGAIGLSNFNDAVAKADGLVDAYLRGHVPELPIPAPVPSIIKEISTELTVYNLYLRRYSANVPDSITKRKASALTQLEKIASGKISLTDAQQSDVAAGNVKVDTQERIFPREVMDQY